MIGTDDIGINELYSSLNLVITLKHVLMQSIPFVSIVIRLRSIP